GLALVCVQPLLVYRAREGEDLTRDKSDPKDAVLIARLASELRCYEPERADAVWARLRHLGARRSQLTTGATAAVNQIRDLLERAHLTLGDWRDTRARLADTETRMAAVLDDLGLTELVTTIDGLTVTGAAAILAETGDPARFATPRALVKHAGLCPRDNSSGA